MCVTELMEVSSSTSRKIRKPLMEKKRRARINHSLSELQRLLIEASGKDGAKAKAAKLEKADILEMTVKHVQYLHDKYRITKEKENISRGCQERLSCPEAQEETLQRAKRVTSISDRLRVRGVTKLATGEVALIVAMENSVRQPSPSPQKPSKDDLRVMWRPW